jgi:glycosyltransferase involved in cell wall biosynthesis
MILTLPRKLPRLIRIPLAAIAIRISGIFCNKVFVNGLYEETYLSGITNKLHCVAKIVGDPIWERAKNSHQYKGNIHDFQNGELGKSLKMQRIFFLKSLSKFNSIIVPGIELSELVSHWLPEKEITYIPNGVRCEDLPTGREEWDLILISRLVSWKNIDLVIEATRELGMDILIVGSGPDFNRLNELAKQSTSRILFLGQVPSKEISSLLAKSRIFVQMSDYEGMSFSLLQAMMLGRAIIASDIKANTDVIEDRYSGLITPVGSQEALRETILNLAHSGKLRKELGLNARTAAMREYCEEVNMKKILKILTRER